MPPKDRAAYYQAHREERQAYQRRYNLIHTDWHRISAGAYYWNHREEALTSCRRYAKTHRDKRNVAKALRRARQQLLPNTLTVEQWRAIKNSYHYRCAYCGTKPDILTQDHVIPIAHGGGTTCDNIVPACLQCNTRKSINPPTRIPAKRLMI